ncbi:MAG: insulinase family protein [Cryobacterium sp.]|nr:insulinase family protein [Cryobacterium sp.]
MNGPIALALNQPELSFQSSEGSQVQRTMLPNGVRILTEAVPGARSSTIGLWVPIGSRDETRGHYGSTHFLEHLLFKGTRKRNALEIAVSFDSVGGEHNALTAKEHTCYYAKVRDQDLPMAVEVLCDMITSSILDKKEFEVERGVILEELAMADDDPSSVANERLFEAVLGEHSLARPIGGNQQSIKAVTQSAVWEHYQANYQAKNLVITVAGAVNHSALVELVANSLDDANWGATDSAPSSRRDSRQANLGPSSPLVVVERPIEQVNVLLGMPGIVATDPRRSVMSVLNAVLGGGMSSRLFQEIREKRGLAYSVYSFSAGYSDSGIFGLYAGCSPAKAKNVVELMRSELEKLSQEGISEEELTRAKGQLSGTAALALEDSDTRMARLGSAEITIGEFSDLDESLRKLDAVTPDAVKDLALELNLKAKSLVAVGSITADELDFRDKADAA